MVKLKEIVHRKRWLPAACILGFLLLCACSNKERPEGTVENGFHAEDAVSTAAAVSPQPTAASVGSSDPADEPFRYQEGQRPRYIEPYGTRAYADDEGVWTEQHGICYSFPLSIEQEQRDSLVRNTDAFIKELERNTGCPVPEGMSVTVLKEHYGLRVLGSALYVGYEQVNRPDYLLGAAQAYFGVEIPHGLIYGLAADTGYIDTPDEVQDMFGLQQRSLLDLNYACFMERYAGEDLEKLRAISLGFYRSLTGEKVKELFGKYSDERFYGALNDYLAENGQDAYENQDIWGIRIQSGGELIRLCWQDEWANYYLPVDFKEWSVLYLKEFQGFGEDPMNTDYTDLRSHMIALHGQIAFARDLLEPYIELKDERIDVMFTETGIYDQIFAGQYSYAENRIDIFSFKSMGHEYAHYLLGNLGIPYSNEHMICYYITDRVPLVMDSMMEMMKWSIETYGSESPYKEIWDRITRYLGRELNWEEKEDIWVLMQVLAADGDNKIEMALTDSRTGYDMDSKSAFAAYLAMQYGEDKMLDALLSDAPQNLGYGSWEEAAKEWDTWVKNNFKVKAE